MARVARLGGGRRTVAHSGARRWLLVFLALALFIGTVKIVTVATGRSNPLDSAINTVFTPLVIAVRYVGEGVGSLGHIFRLPALLRDNRKLEGQVELLQTQMGQTELLTKENEQLRRLLTLHNEAPNSIPARVVARPYDLWLDNVVIGVGSSRGVHPGDLVVSEEGVVGVVSDKVESGLAWVTLIDSTSFRLAGVTSGSACEGVIAGLDKKTLDMLYVTAGSPVKVNEKVYTSGVTGAGAAAGQRNGITIEDAGRPRGILIGTVKHVAEDVNGFLTIHVSPAVDPNRISNVLVYVQ